MRAASVNSRTAKMSIVLGAILFFGPLQAALAIDFSADADAMCSAGGFYVTGDAGITVGAVDFDVCVGTSQADAEACCLSGPPCTITVIDRVTLLVAPATCQGSASSTCGGGSVVLCDGDCTNPVNVTVPIADCEVCQMYAGELSLFVELPGDSGYVPITPDKPPPNECRSAPTVSNWSVLTVACIALCMGTISIRQRRRQGEPA